MNYSNTTTKDGAIQHIEDICDFGDAYISGDTSRLKNWTAKINRIQHRIWSVIFKSTRNWQYDDGGYSDLPSSKTNLVTDQRKYQLPSDALTVQRVEVLDENDNWYMVKALSKEQITTPLDEFMDVSGTPTYYRLVGDTMELYPASNYDKASGLRVYYDRDSVDFLYTDTTKTFGWASPYHELAPIKASIEWLKIKQPTSPTLQLLLQDEARLEQDLKEFYSARFKAKTPVISRRPQNFK